MNTRKQIACPQCGEHLVTISEIEMGCYTDTCIPETRKISDWSDAASVIPTDRADVVEVICQQCGGKFQLDYQSD